MTNQISKTRIWVVIICSILLIWASIASFYQYGRSEDELSTYKAAKSELWSVNKKLWEELKSNWIDAPVSELTAMQVLLNQDNVKREDLALRASQISDHISRAVEQFTLIEPYFNGRGGEKVSTNQFIVTNQLYSHYIEEVLLSESNSVIIEKGSEEHKLLLDNIELLLQDYQTYKYYIGDLHINENGPHKIYTGFTMAVKSIMNSRHREDHPLYNAMRNSLPFIYNDAMPAPEL
ncbi:hypothetical protein ACFSVM_09455 [Paenibacillus shunpengii]|uniref:Uncharacterized protein n=1 Tax=Paenibacillus shunpengii TaxID=2054424 RepID=A0ABW5SNN7_9BACL|nr:MULTISPECIES: hypothetical protein [unclassified Paenibacillus]OMC64391.1 hypothetical protein BK126_25015 [Paenibacillus sp. FSL H7-0326]SDX56594.1 hypothetical protein SAMN05518848_10948 [Paenibacillus sp. PDC88]